MIKDLNTRITQNFHGDHEKFFATWSSWKFYVIRDINFTLSLLEIFRILYDHLLYTRKRKLRWSSLTFSSPKISKKCVFFITTQTMCSFKPSYLYQIKAPENNRPSVVIVRLDASRLMHIRLYHWTFERQEKRRNNRTIFHKMTVEYTCIWVS